MAVQERSAEFPGFRLKSESGLRIELTTTGAIRRFDCGDVAIALFIGNELDGAAGNLYLRRLGANGCEHIALLGPTSVTRFDRSQGPDDRIVGRGQWGDLRYTLTLALAKSATAWFWHVRVENLGETGQRVDLTYAQDLGLAHYGAVRLNEFYVSQYLDHTPLRHEQRGVMIATRQNQAVGGRIPWSLIGSLRSGRSFATDALQFHGLAARSGATPAGLAGELPSHRLQHEHSLAVIRDAPIVLGAGARADAGFFGGYWPDHPEATSSDDLARVGEVLSLPEAQAPHRDPASITPQRACVGASLFTAAPALDAPPLDAVELESRFSGDRRHVERAADGALLSFFHGDDARHVVLPAKEQAVLRPHGHLLRTGRHLTPDESALTSTAWMSGVFHSMVTQGHVSINRMLSTVHTYLGLFRSHGLRVFVEIDERWRLLDMPSAFEMSTDACRWIYRHAQGELQVRAAATSDPQALTLDIDVISGRPLRCLISQHVALNGDDGSVRGPALWRRDGGDVVLTAAPDSDVGRRFPDGSFRIAPRDGTRFEDVAGDERLFPDGRSRAEPFLCITTERAAAAGLSIRGHLIDEKIETPLRVAAADPLIPRIAITGSAAAGRLADIAPWFAHDALVHYLSPRGLEQYSGGGWGTRDVTQGPVEMLLALDRVPPVRDLLLRVMRQQNADGDWPQWFMFFDRERNIRPGDSHGDIVFWPLLVLGQYLIASGDGDVLNERVPYFNGEEDASVWDHAQRALRVIANRVIPNTALAAYGHGDWNDSLQPADPTMRERLCSAWTVTLHVQTLTTLARGLRAADRASDAAALEQQVEAVRRDFQRLLIAGGVLTGYALFEEDGSRPRYLLHPSDTQTGVKYSALAMIHAVLEDLFTQEQARHHLHLLESELSGPDGVRLFDRPMQYHGGPQRLFQRAESATFFGREIGLMYTHAHLRYAQALAHVGDAERFFRALCQANPIAIGELVESARPRQANCYYSSSDAAFDDRYQARDEYARVAQGTVPLEGGWRVYSSGAGIALGLIVRRFLGVSVESGRLSFDPVVPPALDGMRVRTHLLGRPVEIVYTVRGAGCGVKQIVLGGYALPFSTAPNPHRQGAALVDRKLVESRLRDEGNLLRLHVG
jgi:cellobiose phosphorylase